MYKVLVIIEPKRSYERELLEGILKYSRRCTSIQFQTLPPYYLSDISSTSVKKYLKEFHPDGLIIREEGFLEQIKDFKLPLIVSPFKHLLDGYCNIVSDDKKISLTVAKYFSGLGLRKLAFIGLEGFFWSEQRASSFKAVINRQELNVLSLTGSWGMYKEQIKQFITSLPFPTGLYCVTDEMAQLSIEVAKELNIGIPKDIAVVGVDNDPLICELTNTAISSIDHDTVLCGYVAAQKMERMLVYKEQCTEDISSDNICLIKRSSSDNLYSSDKTFNQSVAYINQYAASELLNVNSLCARIGVSRRKMERIFQEHTSITIKQLIDGQKTEKIKELLLTTNLSVGEIAIAVGLKGQENLSRFFKRVEGINPSEFRKNKRIS